MDKTISKRQLEANRKNGKLGGVKTSEGKEISKMNALKHGLLCKEVLLEGENEISLVELGISIREEIKPIGELETILTERIVSNIWRLRRVLEVERNTMEWQRTYEKEEGVQFGTSDEQVERKSIREMLANDDIEKITRYETKIDKSIYKALHELQRLQSARAGDKPPAPLAVDVDVSS